MSLSRKNMFSRDLDDHRFSFRDDAKTIDGSEKSSWKKEVWRKLDDDEDRFSFARHKQTERETVGEQSLEGSFTFEPDQLLPDNPLTEDTLTVSYSAADFTGAGQTVVVIDTGYSPYYDSSSVVFEYDFSGANDPSASVTSFYSHGAWVGQTVTNEAEDASIIHLKVFPDQGAGASFFDIDEALDFVIDNVDNYDISAVNLSLGYGNATRETWSWLSDEFATLDALGVFSVVAGGNSGYTYSEGVNVIAADPNVIGVSAVDRNDAFAGFSQRDDDLTDIAALGVNVEVETIFGSSFGVSGTSFAAPIVSGIAARLQEAAQTVIGEDLTDEEFVHILQQSGAAVAGTATDGSAPAGYKVADGDAAVQYFLDNAGSFGPLDDILIA